MLAAAILFSAPLFLISACSPSPAAEEPDLFEYEGAAVGNNSAVVNTIIQLPAAENFTGIKLETKEQPYGINVFYDWTETSSSDKETAAHNATYLFALIDNAEWIQFDFDTGAGVEQYRLTRERLQAWYGVDLTSVDKQKELEELLDQYLAEDQKIDALLTES
ncbi:DUF4825 domain-containing protein [Planococcus sp. SSTMD024]|uniref:DUF4825 domain-containing protein n=1 Tax=Planococcus sp. SSTMD024 TaxID=3242163 RepID=UPI00351F0D6B